jgi:hypothetical protein
VVRNSVVSENTSTLTSNLPSFGDGQLISMNANAGGIHVGGGIATRVENAAIIGNSATATEPQGEPIGFDAGMLVGNSPLVMHNAQIDDNRATTTSATLADVGPSGTALELDGGGTISNTSILRNVAISVSPGGAAATNGGLAVFNFAGNPKLVTVEDSVMTGNITKARSWRDFCPDGLGRRSGVSQGGRGEIDRRDLPSVRSEPERVGPLTTPRIKGQPRA